MKRIFRFHTIFLVSGLVLLVGCVASGPTLDETRRGQGRVTTDAILRTGEIRAEVLQVRPSRNEIEVRSDDNRTRLLNYDLARTRVIYNGREYSAENLEAGDIIAFQPQPRDGIVGTIRVQEPVQARAGSRSASRVSPTPRREVIEGTVDRIDHDRGIFEVRTRDGSTVTVALPYNARPSEVDEFRRLRPGDRVQLEGEFINRNNFQVSAFSR